MREFTKIGVDENGDKYTDTITFKYIGDTKLRVIYKEYLNRDLTSYNIGHVSIWTINGWKRYTSTFELGLDNIGDLEWNDQVSNIFI